MGMRDADDEMELLDIDLDWDDSDVDLGSVEENHTGGAMYDSNGIDTEVPQKGVAYIVREIFSYVVIVVVAIVVSLAINQFVVINANVPTRSMVPTINAGDKLFGYRLAYMFSGPERGDIVIFEHQCYSDSQKEALIKRIIGVPGDCVEIKEGILYVNGEAVEEEYLAEAMYGDYGPFEVPDNSYFMLGDNRNLSDDARFWDNTYVAREDILAKAVFKYSPTIEMLE